MYYPITIFYGYHQIFTTFTIVFAEYYLNWIIINRNARVARAINPFTFLLNQPVAVIMNTKNHAKAY